MSQITASMVKELRESTLAGMADCKKALEETGGDFEKAAEWLRKKGITKASQGQGRIATEGSIFSYIHTGGKLGVLLEINCQTDFVARTDEFQTLGRNIALHIAGRDPHPQFVSDEEVPAEMVEKERRILMEKALESGKPESVLAKIVDGQVLKWKKELCLLDQDFVKDPTKDIRTLVLEFSSKTGEKVTIRRFCRYALGEGLTKKTENFAEEVAAQLESAQKKA